MPIGQVAGRSVSTACHRWRCSTGQIHRTYFLGCEPNATWRRLHEVAVTEYERIQAVLRDGTELDEVLDAADYVHEAGFTIFDDLLHAANQYRRY